MFFHMAEEIVVSGSFILAYYQRNFLSSNVKNIMAELTGQSSLTMRLDHVEGPKGQDAFQKKRDYSFSTSRRGME
jgi:hypothetical protein